MNHDIVPTTDDDGPCDDDEEEGEDAVERDVVEQSRCASYYQSSS